MLFLVLIFGPFILAAIAALVYVFFGLRRFRWVRRLRDTNRVRHLLCSLLPVLLLAAVTVREPVTGVIALIHLMVFWMLADLSGVLIRRFRRRRADDILRRTPSGADGTGVPDSGDAKLAPYWQGALAIVVTVVYLGIGWYLAHHVVQTNYALTTAKDLGGESVRIAQISDSHLGSTFDGEQFAVYMQRVQETQPDLVVVTGDFVDDDSTREDMEISCRALGKLQTTYGVYFIWGNHDRGYGGYRNFTWADLESCLAENNVHLLADESVLLGDHLCLIGREDRSYPGRASMEELMRDIDKDRYIIVLDHQPHDFAAQQQTGADLVLCGHTHGGQMFPVGILGEVSGANEKTYGLETRGSTSYIVNSGISDWAIPFKTGCIAEYGIIDVMEE